MLLTDSRCHRYPVDTFLWDGGGGGKTWIFLEPRNLKLCQRFFAPLLVRPDQELFVVLTHVPDRIY